MKLTIELPTGVLADLTNTIARVNAWLDRQEVLDRVLAKQLEVNDRIMDAAAKAYGVEATTDPAPGHPELPLMPSAPPPAAVLPDPEPEPLDFTRRVLPLPAELSGTLPPVPEGKEGWVYRGTFGGNDDYPAPDRIVMFFDPATCSKWHQTSHFSCNVHHIEAV